MSTIWRSLRIAMPSAVPSPWRRGADDARFRRIARLGERGRASLEAACDARPMAFARKGVAQARFARSYSLLFSDIGMAATVSRRSLRSATSFSCACALERCPLSEGDALPRSRRGYGPSRSILSSWLLSRASRRIVFKMRVRLASHDARIGHKACRVAVRPMRNPERCCGVVRGGEGKTESPAADTRRRAQARTAHASSASCRGLLARSVSTAAYTAGRRPIFASPRITTPSPFGVVAVLVGDSDRVQLGGVEARLAAACGEEVVFADAAVDQHAVSVVVFDHGGIAAAAAGEDMEFQHGAPVSRVGRFSWARTFGPAISRETSRCRNSPADSGCVRRPCVEAAQRRFATRRLHRAASASRGEYDDARLSQADHAHGDAHDSENQPCGRGVVALGSVIFLWARGGDRGQAHDEGRKECRSAPNIVPSTAAAIP